MVWILWTMQGTLIYLFVCVCQKGSEKGFDQMIS
jgi:hypothetical protein